jgi:hypothetical protein
MYKEYTPHIPCAVEDYGRKDSVSFDTYVTCISIKIYIYTAHGTKNKGQTWKIYNHTSTHLYTKCLKTLSL